MADLLTLDEYRLIAGVDPTDTRPDTQIEAWLPLVSAAVRSLTERDFGSAIVTESRTFEYDGSGYLDIDDASEIEKVTFNYPGGVTIDLDPDSYTPKPTRRDDSPVYHYIEIPPYAGWMGGSPEMGFKRNLDIYAREANNWRPTQRVTVLGTWGWPTVPPDVKMAAVWTLQEWYARPRGDGLTSESIEGWSRSWGGRSGEGISMAVPARARDILMNYAKVNS